MSEITWRNSDQRHAGYAPTVQSEPLPAPRMHETGAKRDQTFHVADEDVTGADNDVPDGLDTWEW